MITSKIVWVSFPFKPKVYFGLCVYIHVCIRYVQVLLGNLDLTSYHCVVEPSYGLHVLIAIAKHLIAPWWLAAKQVIKPPLRDLCVK